MTDDSVVVRDYRQEGLLCSREGVTSGQNRIFNLLSARLLPYPRFPRGGLILLEHFEPDPQERTD
jgi:hypothetical protein